MKAMCAYSICFGQNSKIETKTIYQIIGVSWNLQSMLILASKVILIVDQEPTHHKKSLVTLCQIKKKALE